MFTRDDVNRFVKAADLPRGAAEKNVELSRLSKEEKKLLLYSADKDNKDKLTLAALLIQKTWHGYRIRSLLYSILKASPSLLSCRSSSFELSSICSELIASLNTSRLSERIKSREELNNSRIGYHYLKYKSTAIENHENFQDYENFCAAYIQRWWRDMLQYIRHAKAIKEQFSDIKILNRTKSVLSKIDAAKIIQRCWRKHIDVHLFQYYKKLLLFSNNGSPRHMLKYINPKEAKLLDVASGVHIKFRLGGTKFPPTIYYKIYSHINISDIGSFAPRNYTYAINKELPAIMVHNDNFTINDDDTTKIAYERNENNGWRAVNQRLKGCMGNDPICYETSKKKFQFPHQKLVRRKDLECRRKQKKIGWMRKMYSMGVLETNASPDNNINELVDNAAKYLFDDDDEQKEIEDWEVDEILHWTEGLNFESYVEDWHKTGGTLVCCDKTPRKE